MSTSSDVRSRPAQTARQALKQRGVEATQHLRDVLGLASESIDAGVLGTALAEAAAREIRRNSQFGRDVSHLYKDMMETQVRPTPPKPPKTKQVEPLVAIRHTGRNPDPYAPPDPKELMYVYGEDKLARALQDYTVDKLKQTAEIVQQAHPGTRPASKARKSALIEYIVQYSTNGR
jgi:hypothetical protein